MTQEEIDVVTLHLKKNSITKWKEVNPSEEIVSVYSLVRCRR